MDPSNNADAFSVVK
ncbi:hypothetical protein [Burkholderia sp. AU39826]|nr:hypothetical protein [Burkholderia sp. AU39826]